MSQTDSVEETPRPVVTLFESYGSGAEYVGPRVAEALGVTFHQQAFSSEQLDEEGARDDEGGILSRVFAAMGGPYAAMEGPAVAMAQQDDHQLVMDNTLAVQQAARGGGVIVGRNGALILADWPGALHVKLDGPLEQRIERAARAAGIDRNRAAKRQRREDQVRAEMSIHLYGWDPREPTRYDIVVNTGSMDLDTCVEVIVEASRAKAAARTAAPRGSS